MESCTFLHIYLRTFILYFINIPSSLDKIKWNVDKNKIFQKEYQPLRIEPNKNIVQDVSSWYLVVHPNFIGHMYFKYTIFYLRRKELYNLDIYMDMDL